jgi:hypothetical protein
MEGCSAKKVFTLIHISSCTIANRETPFPTSPFGEWYTGNAPTVPLKSTLFMTANHASLQKVYIYGGGWWRKLLKNGIGVTHPRVFYPWLSITLLFKKCTFMEKVMSHHVSFSYTRASDNGLFLSKLWKHAPRDARRTGEWNVLLNVSLHTRHHHSTSTLSFTFNNIV